MSFRTNFGPFLAEQWKRDFPEQVRSLGRATLESLADREADLAAKDLCVCLEKGVRFEEAAYFACNLRTPFTGSER